MSIFLTDVNNIVDIYLRISEGGSKNVHFLMFYFYNRFFEHDTNYPDTSKTNLPSVFKHGLHSDTKIREFPWVDFLLELDKSCIMLGNP